MGVKLLHGAGDLQQELCLRADALNLYVGVERLFRKEAAGAPVHLVSHTKRPDPSIPTASLQE